MKQFWIYQGRHVKYGDLIFRDGWEKEKYK
jgi:hypothetical protein